MVVFSVKNLLTAKMVGLAMLSGNIALDGCIVKTAGVDESILKFSGKAIVFESQEDVASGILGVKYKLDMLW